MARKYDVFERLRNAGAHVARTHRLLMQTRERSGGFGVSGRTAAGRTTTRTARRRATYTSVRGVDRSALDLLRREVLRGAERRVRRGQVVAGLRDAEVGDEHAAVGRQQDVRRLDVAVDDAAAVRGVERVGDLGQDRDGLARFHGTVLVEVVAQRRAVDELHHDRFEMILGAGVVDRDDRRVRQPRGGDCFASEPRDERLVGGEMGMQES